MTSIGLSTIWMTTRTTRIKAAALAVGLVVSASAAAAEPLRGQPYHFMTMTPEFVQHATRLAKGKLAAELDTVPDLSFDDARDIVNTGAASGFADWCGLDWENRIFLPMARYQRMAMRRPEPLMKYLSLLHGIAQGIVNRDLKKKVGNCKDEDRAAIEAYLTHALIGPRR